MGGTQWTMFPSYEIYTTEIHSFFSECFYSVATNLNPLQRWEHHLYNRKGCSGDICVSQRGCLNVFLYKETNVSQFHLYACSTSRAPIAQQQYQHGSMQTALLRGTLLFLLSTPFKFVWMRIPAQEQQSAVNSLLFCSVSYNRVTKVCICCGMPTHPNSLLA